MLKSLTIRNYAIIDEMTVEFSDGLNVITGETGAGKSVVIDAFELVLGARASSDMVRTGTESMTVTGVFGFDDGMNPDDIPFEIDDSILILRREVRADGNGRCYVNDRPVTLKALKELGDRLVDLHGQHDHQSLLNVSEHVTYLDSYGNLSALSFKVEQLYNEMVNIRKKIYGLDARIKNMTRDRELYEFQINEIETANISSGEDNELVNEIKRLLGAVDLKSLGWELFQELSEADGSIGEMLGGISSRVEHLSRLDTELVSFSEKIEEISVGVNDLADSFREYAEKINDDPAYLAEMEERLALIEMIKKKYGPGLDDVFNYLKRIKKEFEREEELEGELSELKQRKDEIESKLTENASLLSEKRKKSSPLLSKKAEEHLYELGMGSASLVIEIKRFDGPDKLEINGEPVSIGKDGFDNVEFLISANPGEPPKSLVKIASGGEISRVMLSLKLALANAVNVPTMVFDEIDIGVSGRIAESVGKKMLQLSDKRQVIAITHLPQIAVMGTSHFSARKNVDEGRTYSELILLDESEREKELASLLSGETMTDTAFAHAKELLDKVRHEKSFDNGSTSGV
ncbi:DNA repair protein RecN [Candidatus Latescibacterota bacterium]